MVHYDVQLNGGVALHKGKIAEMGTGEGKTVVATLPVFLNALAGRGVHIVTVNDYLSKRDSEWMGPIYEFHGLTVDCIDKHHLIHMTGVKHIMPISLLEQIMNSGLITSAIIWQSIPKILCRESIIMLLWMRLTRFLLMMHVHP